MLGQILIADLKHIKTKDRSLMEEIKSGLLFVIFSEFKQIGLFSNIIDISLELMF